MGDSHHVVELAGKILIISIVVLAVVLILVFFIHLYAKWFWYRRREDDHSSRRQRLRRRRGDGHQEQQSGVTVLRRGLNPSFLNSIPVILFDPRDFKEGLECAVCLSEIAEGEKTRILPKCSHGFHVECIDMWFHSHSSCPICRNSVSEQETVISVENLLGNHRQTQEESSSTTTTDAGGGDSQDFPTNILFWGDETEVSTLTSQLEEANSHHHHHQVPPVLISEPSSSSSHINLLVIDIPTEIDCDEDQKSPVSSRMRSLRRILSGSRRFINPFTPAAATNNNTVEQVGRGHL